MYKYLNPKNYFRFAFNRGLRIISPVLRLWEKKKITCYGNQSLKHQPIFIIGAPRTGSTILYQNITNIFDVLYVDNLTCLFHKNIFFGLWLSNKLYSGKPHDNFQADHGSTLKYGLHAPSECGQFWYRWLPNDHHFIDFDEITDEMVEQIRLEITAVINYWDKPLVFKNLNAGQRLRLLSKCFPDAKFIYIKRNPFFTAQAILRARKRSKVGEHEIWSVKPGNYKDIEKMPELDMVAGQIYFIEKQIENDMCFFANDNFFVLNYEEMVSNFSFEISRIEDFVDCRRKDDKVKIPALYNGNQVKLSTNLRKSLEIALNQYDL